MIGRFKGLVNGEPVYETLAGPTDGQVEKAAYKTGSYAVTITPDAAGDGYVGISCGCKVTYTPYCDVCGDGSCYMGVLETDCFIGKANDADHACTADDACHAKDSTVCPLPNGKVYPTGVATASTAEACRTQYHSNGGYYCTCDGVYYGTVTNAITVKRTATTSNATCRLALFDNSTSTDCASLSVSQAGYNPSTGTLSSTCVSTSNLISPLVSSSADLSFKAGSCTAKLCTNGYYYGNVCGNLCGTAYTSCYVRKVQATDNSYRHLLLTADNNNNDCTTVCVAACHRFIANPYSGTVQIQTNSGIRSGSIYSALMYADNMRTANIYSYTTNGSLNIGGTDANGNMKTAFTAASSGVACMVGTYAGTGCNANYKIPFATGPAATGTAGCNTPLSSLNYEASSTFTYNPSIGRLLVGCISTDAVLVDSIQPKTHNRALCLYATDSNGCKVDGLCVGTAGNVYLKGTYTNGNAAYKIPFSVLTGTGTAGCVSASTGLAFDAENTFTYNPSTNILAVQKVDTGTVYSASIYSPQTASTATTTAFYAHTASNSNVMVACAHNNGLFYHRYWQPTNSASYNMTFSSSTGAQSSGTCSAIATDAIDHTGVFTYNPSTHTLNVKNMCVSGTLAVSSLHACTADCACSADSVYHDGDVCIQSTDCVYVEAENYVCMVSNRSRRYELVFGVGSDSVVAGSNCCFDYSDLDCEYAVVVGSCNDVCGCYDNLCRSTIVGYGNSLRNNTDDYSIYGNTFIGYCNCLIDAPNNRYYNTAVGYHNTVQDCYSTAIGYQSYSADCSVSIGCYAVSSTGGVAIGKQACGGICAVAIGNISCAGCQWSVAIGLSSNACGNGNVAIGCNAYAIAGYSMALGAGAKALGTGLATAIGSCSCAGGSGTTVGYCSYANTYGQALGFCARAVGSYSTAIGCHACACGHSSVAIGNCACAGYACCGIMVHEHVQFGPHHGRITISGCGCLKVCDWYNFGKHFFTNIANKLYCACTGNNVIYRAHVTGKSFTSSSAADGTGACNTATINSLMYFAADGYACSPNTYFSSNTNPVYYPFWNWTTTGTNTSVGGVGMVGQIIW